MNIFPINFRSKLKFLGIFGLLCCLFGTAGCAYRFTNSHIVAPEGIKTIAVEAIYDTGREVMPHELMWGALQNAIVYNGNLKLVPQDRADAILRVQISESRVVATGETKIPGNEPEKDPEVLGATVPPKTNQLRKLTRTGRYKDTAQIGFTAHAKVFHLTSKKILFQKKYQVATGKYWATQGKVKKRNWYLRYIEAGDAAFGSRSESLARLIVQDLLVR